MKDKIKLELTNRRPEFAKGHVCIDLTDAVTGKVKERVEGDNHVFVESLLAADSITYSWVNRVNTCLMCLNDSQIPIDTTVPYLMGQTIGYGIASLGTLNTFRGAYNAASQVLAQQSIDKIRWKFQYDFTTAQANGGTIRQVGLTSQYNSRSDFKMISGFRSMLYTNNSGYSTSDGRKTYMITSAGILTKIDQAFGTTGTIDVSATVGTTDQKCVGYNPSNGKFLISRYSSTAANRKVWIFSDETFSVLENTYTPTNNSISISSSGLATFFYGNNLFYANSSGINKVDFVNNIAPVAIDVGTSVYNNAMNNEGMTKTLSEYGFFPISSKLVALSALTSSNGKGIIFNLETGTVAGYLYSIYTYGSYGGFLYPITNEKIITGTGIGTNANYVNPAITAYQLPTPIAKTTANGLTATYELEVYW